MKAAKSIFRHAQIAAEADMYQNSRRVKGIACCRTDYEGTTNWLPKKGPWPETRTTGFREAKPKP
jgi:hypothetical protein